jgi:cytochrome d ubiquinol oxidase subunit II
VLFVGISAETWFVRPALAGEMAHNALAWLALLVFLAGAVTVFTGLRGRLERRTFIGSGMIIAGLLASGAATIFPVILYSTLAPENSLTAANTAASAESLEVALVWWPIALALAFAYFWFITWHYSGKVKVAKDTQGFY